MTAHAIAILPYGSKLKPALAEMPLADLVWPLGCPKRLEGGRIADMAATDHLIVYAKKAMHLQSHRMVPARLSLLVAEPKIMSARHHQLLRLSHRRFFRVFTYDPGLLGRLPNGVFLPFGTTWVPEWQALDLSKDRDISLIASAKCDHPGHKLRHEIVNHIQASNLEIDILGRGYAPFDKKSDGHARYRYSVVIENVREPNYFTEKLIDAILCDCVPIYWGCPNIEEFFGTEGMILCNSADDIKRALTTAGADDYAARRPALKAAREAAEHFGAFETRAARLLLETL